MSDNNLAMPPPNRSSKVPEASPQAEGETKSELSYDEETGFMKSGNDFLRVTVNRTKADGTVEKIEIDPKINKDLYLRSVGLMKQRGLTDKTTLKLEGREKKEFQELVKQIDTQKVTKSVTITSTISEKLSALANGVKGLWQKFVGYIDSKKTEFQQAQVKKQREASLKSSLKEILGKNFPANPTVLNAISSFDEETYKAFGDFLNNAKDLRAENLRLLKEGSPPLRESDLRVIELTSANVMFQPSLTEKLENLGVQRPEEIVGPFLNKILESSGSINTQSLTDPFTLAIKQEKNEYILRYEGGFTKAKENLTATNQKLINQGFIKRGVEAQYMKFEVRPEISIQATSDKKEYGDVQIFKKGEFVLSYAIPEKDIKQVKIGLDLSELGDINFDECDQIFDVLQKAVERPPGEAIAWLKGQGEEGVTDQKQLLLNQKRDDLRNMLGHENYEKFVNIATKFCVEANSKIAKALMSLGHPELKFSDVETKSVKQLRSETKELRKEAMRAFREKPIGQQSRLSPREVPFPPQEEIQNLDELIPKKDRDEVDNEFKIPLSEFSKDDEDQPNFTNDKK